MTVYDVDQNGAVWNLGTGRRLKLQIRGQYLSVKLYNNGVATRRYVHHLVADKYLPGIEGKNYINHIDGDKLNNKLSNLERVTHSENCLHRNRVLGKSNEGRRGKAVV